MLAYHFDHGGDIDKAEEYLIKAGKEALKSSASSEALYYYKNALELYSKKHGTAVDPLKMAKMEENIGNAFLNKGNLVEAIEYFDRALYHLGEKEPKTLSISVLIPQSKQLLILLCMRFLLTILRSLKEGLRRLLMTLLIQLHIALLLQLKALSILSIWKLYPRLPSIHLLK